MSSSWKLPVPDGEIDAAGYVERRVRDQRDWYTTRADRFQTRRWVFGALVAAVNTVAALLGGAEQGNLMSTGTSFTADPWIAVFTSVSLALTGYATLTSSETLAGSYRATARQLRKLEIAWVAGSYAGPDGFRRFVMDVEQVLAREHATWAKRAADVNAVRVPPVAGPETGLEEPNTLVPPTAPSPGPAPGIPASPDETDPTDRFGSPPARPPEEEPR